MPYIGTCFRFYTQMRVQKNPKHSHIEFIVTSHNSVEWLQYCRRNGNLLKNRVSEICVKRIRVNQGLGVDETNLSLQGEQCPEFQRLSVSQGHAVKEQLDLRSKTCVSRKADAPVFIISACLTQGPKWSTIPLRQWGFRQCLPFSFRVY